MLSTVDRRVHNVRFGAMGSAVHVTVVGGPRDLGDYARGRIEQLEARWSRFRPDSELNRLNTAAGRPVLVSPDTLAAIDAAVHAWRATDGAFDPTVLPALVALGYDRDFPAVLSNPDPSPTPGGTGPAPAPGCAGIEIARIVGAVTLPAGTAIDFGGIGKGLAADLVVAELLDAGAAGACVNVGGDLRVAGAAPTTAGWIVAIEHLPDLRLALAQGAVATSSPDKRRWRRDGEWAHHLLNPRTGRPVAGRLAAVTVLAATAAGAEALTKAAFVTGADGAAAVIESAGATGLLMNDAGQVLALAGVEAFLQ